MESITFKAWRRLLFSLPFFAVLSGELQSETVKLGSSLEEGVKTLIESAAKDKYEQLAVGYFYKDENFRRLKSTFFHSNKGNEDNVDLGDEEVFFNNFRKVIETHSVKTFLTLHTHPKNISEKLFANSTGVFPLLPSATDVAQMSHHLKYIAETLNIKSKKVSLDQVTFVDGVVTVDGLWLFKKMENNIEIKFTVSEFTRKLGELNLYIMQSIKDGHDVDYFLPKVKEFYRNYGIKIDFLKKENLAAFEAFLINF